LPRDGLGVHAGGHTDPHSALGISALGGIRETIEPMIACAAKTVGCTVLALLTNP